ncbi:MAG: hypothetical protein FWC85_01420, partial [Elusimicrobia bacterium]|nr:hypothetical protein [Elusimicrobiota bacterium]
NFGILPLTFKDPSHYARIEQGERIVLRGYVEDTKQGGGTSAKDVITKNEELYAHVLNGSNWDFNIPLAYNLTPRQKELLFAGGLLNWIKQQGR